MSYNDSIGLLQNNSSWDDNTNLNITTKPFQIAPTQTPNSPNTNISYAVFTIVNGTGYGGQLAIGLDGVSYTRGCNIFSWTPWKILN